MNVIAISVVVLAVVQTLHLLVISVQAWAGFVEARKMNALLQTNTEIRIEEHGDRDKDALFERAVRAQEATAEAVGAKVGPDLGVAVEVVELAPPDSEPT